ncbi:MAG: PAS domain S-box protein [Chloroflexi bacterium]|nr:PAS domain S-box protein [Chloroflexota bacterium]
MVSQGVDRLIQECSKDAVSAAHLRVFVDSIIRSDVSQVQTLPMSAQFLTALNRITTDLQREHDEETLLDAIAESASAILEAAYSEVLLKTGDELVVRGTSRTIVELKGERVVRGNAPISWLAHDTRQPVVLDNYGDWPLRRVVYENVQLYAVADIPILTHDGCLGVLALGRSEPDQPFTPEQIQQGIVYAQLVALVLVTESKYAAAQRELEERRRAEAMAQRFQQDLKTLHQINLELTAIPTLDLLFRRAVELALERLDIDRMGIFLVDRARGLLVGTYGTDTEGRVREEKDYQAPYGVDSWIHEIASSPLRAHFEETKALYDYGVLIGAGWRAAAALWDGHQAIGYVVCDNHVRRRPARLYEAELLSLFGTTLGHLITIKQEQDARRLNEDRLRAIIDHVRELISYTDIEGRIEYIGPTVTELLGYEPSQMIGLTLLDICHPDDVDRVGKTMQEALEQGRQPPLIESRMRSADGTYVWVEGSGRFLRDEQGRPFGVISVIRDIGEQRLLQEARLQEERLHVALQKEQELNELKNQVMVRIAHEFRTPLSVVLTSTEMLERYADRLSPAQRGEKMTDIRHAVQRITRILEDILVSIRRQATATQRDVTEIDLLHFCELIVEEVLIDYPKRTSELRIVPARMIADTVMLRSVISNLLSNAFKFSAPDQPVIFEAWEEQEAVCFRVTDQGIGIPADEIERVTDMFYRASNIGEIEGIGLGLSIAHNAVQMLGGRLHLVSEPGRGTMVAFTLPFSSHFSMVSG